MSLTRYHMMDLHAGLPHVKGKLDWTLSGKKWRQHVDSLLIHHLSTMAPPSTHPLVHILEWASCLCGSMVPWRYSPSSGAARPLLRWRTLTQLEAVPFQTLVQSVNLHDCPVTVSSTQLENSLRFRTCAGPVNVTVWHASVYSTWVGCICSLARSVFLGDDACVKQVLETALCYWASCGLTLQAGSYTKRIRTEHAVHTRGGQLEKLVVLFLVHHIWCWIPPLLRRKTFSALDQHIQYSDPLGLEKGFFWKWASVSLIAFAVCNTICVIFGVGACGCPPQGMASSVLYFLDIDL